MSVAGIRAEAGRVGTPTATRETRMTVRSIRIALLSAAVLAGAGAFAKDNVAHADAVFM
jgi:hypothetical protein